MGISQGFISRPTQADEITLTSPAGTISVKDNGVGIAKTKFYFGDGSDGALHVTSGTTTISTPIKQYASIVVDAGTVLTTSTFGKFYIYVTGDVTINGALNVGARVGSTPTTFNAGEGGTSTEGDALGGTAGTASPLISVFTPSQNFIFAESGAGGAVGFRGSSASYTEGSGGGGGGGSYGTGGAGGNGGTGGSNIAGSQEAAPAAGAGRAHIYLFIGGSLTVSATGSINGNGGAGATGTGGTTTSRSLEGGSGGGGGAFLDLFVNGSVTVAASGSITANGGAGGAGRSGTTANAGGGGGGGSGGVIRIYYGGTYTNGGTVTAAAGALGAAGTGAKNGVDGSAGTAGIVRTIQI